MLGHFTLKRKKEERSSKKQEPLESFQWQLPEPSPAEKEEEFEPIEEDVEERGTEQDDYNGVIALDDKEFGKY